MLNSDQEEALASIKRWWFTDDTNYILDGAGGTGKSYLVDAILKSIRCKAIILAPTNEALKQVVEKIEGEYIFKTIHSALGMAPTTHEENLKFEHIALPGFWDEVNFCIVDEASMVSEELLQILLDIGIKTLWVGHKSQLPPVKLKRSVRDSCISPVFEKGWKSSTLTIPMRNTGALWEFNNFLEQMIYNNERFVPKTFDTKKEEITAYVNSPEGISDFLEGKTKVVLWTNNGVDKYNAKIREVIYGSLAREQVFLPKDKIILTKPVTVIEQLERYNEQSLKKITGKKKTEFPSFYANAKAEVINAHIVTVQLNSQIYLQCHKIRVSCEGEKVTFYAPMDEADLTKIEDYYKHMAWSKKDVKTRQNIYREMFFILSLFASVKHFYAATSYRMQGSTIDNVIVVNSDINKCPNQVELKKHRYVACSRTRENLMFYKGY